MSLTVPEGKAGTYFILYDMNVYMVKPAVNLDRLVYLILCKNGVQITGGRFIRNFHDRYVILAAAIQEVLELAVGDVIKARWRVDNSDTTVQNMCGSVPVNYWRHLSLIKLV